jgi:hypothetical protein
MKLNQSPPTGVAGSDYRGKGVLLTHSTGQAITSSPTELVWDNEVYDDLGFHSASVETGRITVPPGVTRIQLIAQVHFPDISSHKYLLDIYKNDSLTWEGGTGDIMDKVAGYVPRYLFYTQVEVATGDFFHIRYSRNTGPTSFTLQTNQTFFCAVVLR